MATRPTPATAAPRSKPGLEAGSVTLDAEGNLVLGGRYIRVVAAQTGTFYGQAMTEGNIYRIAGGGTFGLGDGGPALQAEFTGATAVAVARSGDVYFADAHRIRVLEP